MTFQSLFRSDDSVRDKFLSRLFGIFNEELVRCWAKAPQAPYVDLGRPTLRRVAEEKPYYTFDFTFRSRNDGRVYIVEMKCWLEYENYRYLTLESPSQLDYASRQQKSFRIFLDAARNMNQYTVKVNRRPQAINGSMLIWGTYTEQGRKSVMDEYGLEDVLSLDAIINDLVDWQNQDFTELIRNYDTWCGELFTGLSGLGESRQ